MAWSQNLGHEDVMTTFRNYGEVTSHRQAEIIRSLGEERLKGSPSLTKEERAALEQLLRKG
jgi:hypothetical protein